MQRSFIYRARIMKRVVALALVETWARNGADDVTRSGVDGSPMVALPK